MATTKQDVQGKVGNTIFYKVGMETRVRGISAGYSGCKHSHATSESFSIAGGDRFYQHLAETHLKEVGEWRRSPGEMLSIIS